MNWLATHWLGLLLVALQASLVVVLTVLARCQSRAWRYFDEKVKRERAWVKRAKEDAGV